MKKIFSFAFIVSFVFLTIINSTFAAANPSTITGFIAAPTTKYFINTIPPVNNFTNKTHINLFGTGGVGAGSAATIFDGYTPCADPNSINSFRSLTQKHVTTLSASRSYVGSVTLNWTPVSKATGYKINVYDSTGSLFKSYSGVTGTSINVVGLKAGSTYSYTLQSVGSFGLSAVSPKYSTVAQKGGSTSPTNKSFNEPTEPPTINFSFFDLGPIYRSCPSELDWDTTGAVQCTASSSPQTNDWNGPVPVVGPSADDHSNIIVPGLLTSISTDQTRDYTLTCSNNTGTNSKTITVPIVTSLTPFVSGITDSLDKWNLPVVLAEGLHIFTAKAVSTSGVSSALSVPRLVTVDITPPVFSSAPLMLAPSLVKYTLSEAIASGTVVITTRTDGETDPISTRTCNLVGNAKKFGGHQIDVTDTVNGCASPAPAPLVSGAAYSLAYTGVDFAGNVATFYTTPAQRNSFTYDCNITDGSCSSVFPVPTDVNKIDVEMWSGSGGGGGGSQGGSDSHHAHSGSGGGGGAAGDYKYQTGVNVTPGATLSVQVGGGGSGHVGTDGDSLAYRANNGVESFIKFGNLKLVSASHACGGTGGEDFLYNGSTSGGTSCGVGPGGTGSDSVYGVNFNYGAGGGAGGGGGSFINVSGNGGQGHSESVGGIGGTGGIFSVGNYTYGPGILLYCSGKGGGKGGNGGTHEVNGFNGSDGTCGGGGAGGGGGGLDSGESHISWVGNTEVFKGIGGHGGNGSNGKVIVYYRSYLNLFHITPGSSSFSTSGVFKIPLGVKKLTVETWGGGAGGGGGGFSDTFNYGGAGGGGGSFGKYQIQDFNVGGTNNLQFGTILNVAIGSGGGGGSAGNNDSHGGGDGAPGGNSSVSLGSTVLISAPGATDTGKSGGNASHDNFLSYQINQSPGTIPSWGNGWGSGGNGGSDIGGGGAGGSGISPNPGGGGGTPGGGTGSTFSTAYAWGPGIVACNGKGGDGGNGGADKNNGSNGGGGTCGGGGGGGGGGGSGKRKDTANTYGGAGGKGSNGGVVISWQ